MIDPKAAERGEHRVVGDRKPQKAEPDTYKCLVVDPPWNERGAGKSKRGADRHYPLLKFHEIVETICKSSLWKPDPNSHLWLWATCNHLASGLDVMHALGYRYKTHVVWIKGNVSGVLGGKTVWSLGGFGLGQYVRGVHELLLIGVRGRLKGQSTTTPSAIVAPRREHSRKPDEAYDMIRHVSPGPRAELFATGPRLGWYCWGMVDGKEEVWR